MSRRLTSVTVLLTALVAFLVGAIFAGGVTRSAVVADTKPRTEAAPARKAAGPAASSLVNFAQKSSLSALQNFT